MLSKKYPSNLAKVAVVIAYIGMGAAVLAIVGVLVEIFPILFVGALCFALYWSIARS